MSLDSSTAELTDADQEARTLSVTRFDAPLMLEAGAGTGKTTTLVARIVAWMLGPGWARHADSEDDAARARRVLRGIAAITFTEAAAAEMAERVTKALRALTEGRMPRGLDAAELPEPERLRARAAALLDAADTLNLTTIHAYCAGLLRRFSIMAGLHPRAEVDPEEERVTEVLTELIEERLPEVFGDPGDRDWVALARRGFGPTNVAEGLLALHRAGARPEDLREDPVSPERVADLLDELKGGLLPISMLLDVDAAQLKRAKKVQAVRETLQNLAAEVHREDLELIELVEGRWESAGGELPGPGWGMAVVEVLEKWRKQGPGATELKAIGEEAHDLQRHAERLLPPLKQLAGLDLELLGVGHAVLAPLYAELRKRLVRAGVLSFDDLLSETTTLLERSPTAAEQLREELEFLAVDEFQDTDARQCRLVELLGLEGTPAERPALFVVGDPKQSIYGWRAADLAAYEGFKQQLSDAGGEIRVLSVNYRSDDRILSEVGRVMAGAMHAEPGLQPTYQPLVAGRGEFAGEDAECVTVAYHPDDVGKDRPKRGQLVVREADWVAASLRGWVERLQPDEKGRAAGFGDVALLLRSTGDLERYLDAFKRFEIPFAVARDKSYYRRREVIEAAALVRCVLDPRDQVALVTWIRSATVGVPDAALLPLWRAELPAFTLQLADDSQTQRKAARELVERAAGETPTGAQAEVLPRWPQALLAALEDLGALRRGYADLSADRFVEFLRRRTLVEATEASRFLGTYREANLERFFRQLGQAIELGAGDRTRVLRKLRESVAASLEAEEGRPRGSDEDAVQVMTVHKSKGLDFRVVVLGQLYKERRKGGGGPAFAFAIVGRRAELRLFGAASLAWHHVATRAAQVEAYEAVRLLYVAMTRAKDHLVLACSQPFADRAKPTLEAGSLESLLASREPELPAPPGDPAEGAEDASAAEADTDPTPELPVPAPELPRGVALTPMQDVVSALGAPAASEVSAAEAARGADRARADAETIRTRREDAAGRAERPRLSPVSSLKGSHVDQGEPLEETGRGVWAAELGTLVHAALELVARGTLAPADLQAHVGERLAKLAAGLEETAAEALLERGAELLVQLGEGPLVDDLAGLGERVVATELPLLLCTKADATDGPLEGHIGVLDLLYREPDGQLVVADYKSDAVRDDAHLQQLVDAYRTQVQLYARAVQAAMQLDQPPRTELWMLDRGERCVL